MFPAVGLLSLEPESSPEWLLGPESDLLAAGLGPFRPDTDPDELELLLVAVASPPLCRVRRGETGEPRSSSRKSGLLAWQLSESRRRSLSESTPGSEMGFPECDISKKKDKSLVFFLCLKLWCFLRVSAMRPSEATPTRRRAMRASRRDRQTQKQQQKKKKRL